MRNSSTNVGFLIPKEKFSFYPRACDELFITSKYIKVDVVMTVLKMNRLSIVHEMLNEILRKLTPSGISQYLLTYHASIVYGTDEIIKERTLEILSIDDLKFVFFLWIFGCGTAAITLGLEIFRVCQLRKVLKMILWLWKSFLNKIGVI